MTNKLKNWEEISSHDWNSLLLGNGFSMNIHGGFSYKSLYESIIENGIWMYPCLSELFEKMNNNFEEVLSALYYAELVHMYNKPAISTLYRNVKEALIQALESSHVEYQKVPLQKVADALSNFREIYTTNYDLIPYWAFMDGHSHKFCDFFWGPSFDSYDTDIYDRKTPIYYMHGAIHLRINEHGSIYKVSTSRDRTIQDILNDSSIKERPLFITEGLYEEKHKRIMNNNYLHFCFTELERTTSNLVIYGHSLTRKFDGHILDALIKKPQKRKIAISIFSGLTEKEKALDIARFEKEFQSTEHELYFFESKSHPLSLQM